MKVTALFRPPNNPYIAEYILSTRRQTMGELLASNTGAAFTLASILEKGGNIGVLVDQKFIGGLNTDFLRPALRDQPGRADPGPPLRLRCLSVPLHPPSRQPLPA